MGKPRFCTRYAVEIFLLIVFSAAIYIGTCSKPSLFDEADATNAEVGYQILRTGDWITPQSNYVPRLNKPPMPYWVTALSYEVFGLSDFSARLPFALAAMGVVLTLFLIGNLATARRSGFYSAIILASSLGFFLFTRTIAGDILFVFFLTLAFYLFLKARLEPNGRVFYYMMGFWASLGLAVMSKGLIGLVFPVLTIGAYLLVSHDLRFIKQMRFLPGILVLLAMAAPWHILVGLRNPGFFYEYFINEHVLRFLNMHYPKDFRSIPLWEFWLIQAVGLFPWIFLIFRVRRHWPSDFRRMSRDESLIVFFAAWAASVVLFFSVSARLEHYALPAYPACAAIAGLILARETKKGSLRSLMRVAAPVAAIGLVLGVGGIFFVLISSSPCNSAIVLGSHNKLTFFGAVGGISENLMEKMRTEVIISSAGLLLIALAILVPLRKGRAFAMVVGILLGISMIFTAIQRSEERAEPYLTLKSLAIIINHDWRPGDSIAIEGEFFNMSSVGFYTRKPIYRWRGHPEWDFGSRIGNAREMYLDDAQLLQKWHSRSGVYLVADKSVLQSVDFLRSAKVLGVSGDSVLVTNR